MIDRSLWQRFVEIADRDPNRPAIIDVTAQAEWTYGMVRERAEGAAEILASCQEQFIVQIGEPDGASLPLVLAATCAGKTFVPLSDREPPARLAQMIQGFGDRLVVCPDAGCADALGLGQDRIGLGLDGLMAWRVADDAAALEGTDAPFLITHSSGSTGLPKAIAISQAVKLKRSLQSIELFGITPDDRVLSVSPLHHSLGQRHLFVSLLSGAALIKAYPFVPDRWITAARAYRSTLAIAVATHLKVLQPALSADPGILDSFRVMVTSSAPAEAEFKTKVLDAAAFEFWEIYGMTEAACVTAVRYQKGLDTAHLGTALPGVEIRIRDGEIQLKSAYLCDGYFGAPARWQDAFTEDGWFRSGDLGRIDERGRLYYLGRQGESFQSAGLVVFPAEVEAGLQGCRDVLDCVAFGVPNTVFENLVGLAYVPSHDAVTDRDILAFARTALPKHCVPARICRFERFPTLTSGKLDRKQIVSLSLEALRDPVARVDIVQ
ncbi:malonyl-CoA synthase [Roseibium aquae]|uniref:Malonyl-CoA synthase n=1 Tax=Roseibium aquae TaxID=1323746 RepID=A0A916THM5_9HYPH|nr:class I adenylate-forming enzyme family protein [Roseibium aquae]GGB45654.1 malonyl-CoA synthase [Roseibium aquae]